MDKLNITNNFNYLGISESLSDYELIKNYCVFFNDNIMYQIFLLTAIFILMLIFQTIIRILKIKNNKIKVAVNGLQNGFIFACGFWLVMTSGYLLVYHGFFNTEFSLLILKVIFIFILFIITFVLYSLGYIDKLFNLLMKK